MEHCFAITGLAKKRSKIENARIQKVYNIFQQNFYSLLCIISAFFGPKMKENDDPFSSYTTFCNDWTKTGSTVIEKNLNSVITQISLPENS